MWICVCFRNQGNRNHLRKRRGWNTLIHCINSFSCSAEQPSQKSGGFSDMLFEIQGSSKYEIFSAPTQLSWYFDKQLHKKIGYPCIRPQSTLGSTVPVGPLHKRVWVNPAIKSLLMCVFPVAVNWMRIISTWPMLTSWLRYHLLNTSTRNHLIA